MKKAIALILVVSLMLSLVACGSDPNATPSSSVSSAASVPSSNSSSTIASSASTSSTPINSIPSDPDEANKPVTSLAIGDDYSGFGNIDWLIIDLDIEAGKALLIPKGILTYWAFSDKYEEVTWETSGMRAWLNSAFLEDTFNDEEKALILETEVENKGNAEGLGASANTMDKVFLLSLDEVSKYFTSDEARLAVFSLSAEETIALATRISEHEAFDYDYQKVLDELTIYQNTTDWWYTRTPGASLKDAASVSYNGELYVHGNEVSEVFGGVRPVIWIQINKTSVSNVVDPNSNPDPIVSKPLILKNLKVGDELEGFGNLDWLVIDLDTETGKALIIPKGIAAYWAFSDKYEEATWETSGMRAWLNSAFLEDTFSDEEKVLILETDVENKGNVEGLGAGANTIDKVFLLSLDEVSKYFTSDEARLAVFSLSQEQIAKLATMISEHEVFGYDYQKVFDELTLYQNTTDWWYTRTPGALLIRAASVSYNGELYVYGNEVSEVFGGVRPALWIDLTQGE